MIAKRDTVVSDLEYAETCPPNPTLSDFLNGAMGADAFNAVALHLNDCGECRKRLDQLPESDHWAVRFQGQPDQQFLEEPDLSAAIVACVASPHRSSEITSLLPPVDHIGAYQLIRPLGKGGMGTVYLARHQTLQRLCAIKLLPRTLGAGKLGTERFGDERFDREVQSLAAIDHPGVVTATDAGIDQGWRYLVMQYVEGVDLADVLDSKGSLPISVVCRIGADIASALAAIHHANLIHRDVKPANVMLTHGGEIKVLDFGLAAAATTDTDQDRLTTVGDLIGTVAYAAPEQLAGHSPSPAADWYAFGSTLFRMVTGTITHPVAARRGLTSLMMAKSQVDWEPSSQFDDGCLKDFRDLVAGLLAREPGNRLIDSGAIIQTLRRHAEPDDRVLTRIAGAVAIASDKGTDACKMASSPVSLGDARKPPTRSSWAIAAAGFLGGGLAIAAAGWLIEVDTPRGRVSVETDQNDATVRVIERPITESKLEIQSGTKPSGTFDFAKVDLAKLNAIYGGTTVREHLLRLENELDVDTLVESIEAVSRVAEADDVDLVQATLIPARRYGGWISGGGSPSSTFMDGSEEAYRNLLVQPRVKVALREFDQGNHNSLAVVLWRFLTEGTWEHLPFEAPEDLDRLIEKANQYQAEFPAAVNTWIPNQHRTTQQMNVAWIRGQLVGLADVGVLKFEKILSIRDWLPATIEEPDKSFAWMQDEALLRELDQGISQYVAEGKAAELPETKIWQTVWAKPWPMPSSLPLLNAAEELDIAVAMPVQMETIFHSGASISPDEQIDAAGLEPLTETELTLLANYFTLYNFQMIRFIEDTARLTTKSIPNQRTSVRTLSDERFSGVFGKVDLRDNSFQRPIDQARKIFASRDVWLPKLDQMRQHTSMPKTMDLMVQCLAIHLSGAKQHPNIINLIAYQQTDPLNKASVTHGGWGGGAFSGAGQDPSAKDKAKAKQIAEELDAYLEKHVAEDPGSAVR